MDGKRLRLDEDALAFHAEREWEWLAFAELTVRDGGLPFSAENVAWTKEFAERMATWETMVRAGLFLKVKDADTWGAVL